MTEDSAPCARLVRLIKISLKLYSFLFIYTTCYCIQKLCNFLPSTIVIDLLQSKPIGIWPQLCCRPGYKTVSIPTCATPYPRLQIVSGIFKWCTRGATIWTGWGVQFSVQCNTSSEEGSRRHLSCIVLWWINSTILFLITHYTGQTSSHWLIRGAHSSISI
jgi:hypothetical protein